MTLLYVSPNLNTFYALSHLIMTINSLGKQQWCYSQHTDRMNLNDLAKIPKIK
jgi:hypothetical protein